MKAFAYRSATSEESAAKLLGDKALPLAGGTNLINLMKNFVLQPEVLVDIKKIPGTAGIELASGTAKIGANTLLADIAQHEGIRREYPALAQATAMIGTPQIRNMGTLGGNLCQRPYCWYFTQEVFDCLKRGGTTCPAKKGENEYHAIFENDGPCVIVHPSSAAPALVVLGARVRIAGKAARELPIEEFFALPKDDVRRENVLAPDEIVTHVILGPARPKSATYAVREKDANDWPVSLAAVALELEGETVKTARICLGAVAPVPLRAKAAEAALAGKKVTEAVASAAADAALAGAKPLAKNGYKVRTAHACVKRAVLLAAGIPVPSLLPETK
jgi:xanthine dehydrogenase YagS FAD-binding subunit